MAKKINFAPPKRVDQSYSLEVRSFSIESIALPVSIGSFQWIFDIGSIRYLQALKIVGIRVDVVVKNAGNFRRTIGSQVLVTGNNVSLPKVPKIINSLVDSSLSNRFAFTTSDGNNHIPCEIEITGGNFDTEINVTGIDTIAGVAGEEATAFITVFYQEMK